MERTLDNSSAFEANAARASRQAKQGRRIDPISLSEFVRRISESRLVSAIDLSDTLTRLDPKKATAEAFAEILITRKLLTVWEARQIAAGRGRFLLLEDRYRLCDKIGEGGMGAVFRAYDSSMDRQVVIKVPRTDRLAHPNTLKRFRREARANGRLEHPNIVRALNFGSDGPIHFIVFEYVAGEDLRAYLARKGTLRAQRAVQLVVQVADALAFAHQQGVIHRDIKPSNILVTPEGVVKVLDLGFARLLGPNQGLFGLPQSSNDRLTRVGTLIGTVDYVAPEQARDTQSADIRSDIYSLGCTLYEMLSGKAPFDGATPMAVLLQHVNQAPPPIAGLDPTLQKILATMMAKKPEERYQTPHILAVELRRWLYNHMRTMAALAEEAAAANEIPPAIRTLAESDRPTKTSVNNPMPHVTLTRGITNPPLQAAPQNTAAQPSQHANAATDSAADIPNWLVTASYEQATPRRSRSATYAVSMPQRWLIAAGGAVLASICLLELYMQTGRTTMHIDWPESIRTGGRLEVDGKAVPLPTVGPIAVHGSWGSRQLKLHRPGYRDIVLNESLTRGADTTITPNWNPTPDTQRRQEFTALEEATANLGNEPVRNQHEVEDLRKRLVAFRDRWTTSSEAQESAVLLARIPSPFDDMQPEEKTEKDDRSGLPLAVVFAPEAKGSWTRPNAVAFTPDGQQLAFGSRGMGARLWTSKEKEVPQPLSAGTTFISDMEFDASGDRLAMAHSNGTVEMWRAADATTKANPHPPRQLLWKKGTKGQIVEFLRDGKQVALTGITSPTSVDFCNSDTGVVEVTFVGHRGEVDQLALSPNGILAASCEATLPNQSGEVKIWEVNSGAEWFTLKHTSGISALAFHPNGGMLAVGTKDGKILLWDVQSGTKVREFEGHTGDVQSLAFRPDGSWLASSDNGMVRLWNLETRMLEHAYQIGPSGARVGKLAFSPEGRYLATANGDGSVYVLRLPAPSRRRFAQTQ